MGWAVATSPSLHSQASTTPVPLIRALVSHPRLPLDRAVLEPSRAGVRDWHSWLLPSPTCVWGLLVWLRGKGPSPFTSHSRARALTGPGAGAGAGARAGARAPATELPEGLLRVPPQPAVPGPGGQPQLR